MTCARHFAVVLGLVICLGFIPAQAQDLLFDNSDFEMGDQTNWTIVSGTAWEDIPDSTTPWGDIHEGEYCATSVGPDTTNEEFRVGVLRSTTFTVPVDLPDGDDVIDFLIAGWANEWHRVELRLASDDSIIATAQVPNTAASFQEQSFASLNAYAGEELYLEIHDENNDGDPDGSGWVAVDSFHWRDTTPPPTGPAEGEFTNGDFETGDLTGWRTYGNAWAIATSTDPVGAGKEGEYYAGTFAQGETATGTLTSAAFTVDAEQPVLSFLIGGWDGWPDDTAPKGVNFVHVKRVSDDEVIGGPVAPPNQDAFAGGQIDLSDYVGESVYIEAVDGDDAAGFAWIIVDNFHMTEAPEGPVDNPVTAMRAITTPIMNGVIDAEQYPGAPVTITTDNSVNVDWGGANPTVDPEDCSFDIYASWDDDALYIALDVTDDVVMISDEFWGPESEMIQIVLAQANAVAREAGSLSDIMMHPDGGIEWENNPGGGDVDWGDANITGDWALTDTGYILEVRFPWEDFNIALPTIEAGAQLRALFAVVDRDEPGEFNAFVLSSGRQGENPFENHGDLSFLTLDLDPDTSYSGDGWTYQQKTDLGLDPFSADSSGDGVPDWWIEQNFDDWVDKALDPTFGGTVLDPESGYTIRRAFNDGVDPNDPATWPDLEAVPASDARTLALLIALMLGISAVLATTVLKRRAQ